MSQGSDIPNINIHEISTGGVEREQNGDVEFIDTKEFLLNSIGIKKRLTFDYKLDNNIDWCPNLLPTLTVPAPSGEGTGSNNVHYVIPKKHAIFGGRTMLNSKQDTTWQSIELLAKTSFALTQLSTSLTRNYDFVRKFNVRGQEKVQLCEIKKTTGSFAKPPVFLRSSLKQLQTLCSYRQVQPNQISPSLYICGSTDFDTLTQKWIVTWWIIPCKSLDDFMFFNTSNFHWVPPTTPTNDGWFTPP